MNRTHNRNRVRAAAIVAAVSVLAALATPAQAHPGGVDTSGCHVDRRRGGYHCHGAPRPTTSPTPSAPATSTSAPKAPPPAGGSASPGSKASPTRPPIRRSAKAKNDFRRANPCPVTGRTSGACPGWEVDHVKPLACGGADAPANMQWLTAKENRKKGAMGCRR